VGHDGALLSEALHHGRQERDSPDGHGIALLNVKLLAVSGRPMGADRDSVLVELTTAQQEVLILMQKHGTKLGIRLREKEKPKK
jgi:hypothetical protein